mmetsp:Transcript_16497/g.29920  ORF Transcript_16497/g.29920 Transcript_16497/m.29920 type:complete len:391 (+) Transcript_16497:295-1467(+)
MSMFTNEASLLPIGEEESFEIVEEPTLGNGVAEADLKKAKSNTAVLEHEAEKNILEMQRLLGKSKTRSASRSEKGRLLSLNSKLSALKKDIEESRTVEEDTEVTLLRSKTRSKVTGVKLAMKEKDIRRALQVVQSAESVDIAFVVDCTSSMGPYISSVKESIQGIVERVRATNQSMNLRLAIVCYRDMGDSPRFEVLDFVTSVDLFKGFLANLSAIGGADIPEDMAGALKETNKLSWTHPSKVAFIIADAPCHGMEFHSCSDSYPNGTPGVDIIEELLRLQKQAGQGTMSLTFGRITNQTDLMIESFQGSGISIDQVGIEEARKLTKTVTASVRKSIFKTVTTKRMPGASVAFAPISSIGDLLKTGHRSKRTSTGLKDYTISPSHPKTID